MTLTSNLKQATIELTQTFWGQLLFEESDGYEEARKVHNNLIDK